MRKGYLLLVLWIIAAFVFPACEARQVEEIVVVSEGQAKAVIVIGLDAGEVIGNAAKAFQQEIQRRTGIILPIRYEKAKPGNVVIHIANLNQDTSANKALAALGSKPVTADNPGKEGFLLVSGKKDNAKIVVVNGCDGLGSFHGVGWLLRRMVSSIPLALTFAMERRAPLLILHRIFAILNSLVSGRDYLHI